MEEEDQNKFSSPITPSNAGIQESNNGGPTAEDNARASVIVNNPNVTSRNGEIQQEMQAARGEETLEWGDVEAPGAAASDTPVADNDTPILDEDFSLVDPSPTHAGTTRTTGQPLGILGNPFPIMIDLLQKSLERGDAQHQALMNYLKESNDDGKSQSTLRSGGSRKTRRKKKTPLIKEDEDPLFNNVAAIDRTPTLERDTTRNGTPIEDTPKPEDTTFTPRTVSKPLFNAVRQQAKNLGANFPNLDSSKNKDDSSQRVQEWIDTTPLSSQLEPPIPSNVPSRSGNEGINTQTPRLPTVAGVRTQGPLVEEDPIRMLTQQVAALTDKISSINTGKGNAISIKDDRDWPDRGGIYARKRGPASLALQELSMPDYRYLPLVNYRRYRLKITNHYNKNQFRPSLIVACTIF